ncbi:MAG: U32 family peptidase [Clostridia bacterium]|nr:U32 family peptidase [Clostridia bacterium]
MNYSKNNKYTLVCPAGCLETLKIAVNNGANAVYLGVEGFNARSKAGFSREDFLIGIEYAHTFGVKIYVTLNILIKDKEFDKVLELADFVYLNGADSIIVQDLGLYSILKNRYHNYDIHLSTQLGIHNLYGAMVCEQKLGAKHIVLSRETLLEDIKKIKEKTKLSLEFFVQGALCVAFSGNCYYSSMMTGGSGNRGTCFQFCRKRYKFLDEEKSLKEGFLLSPSDIMMAEELQDLINAGITHFKIEGRNRRSAYVGGATRIYSQALKGIYLKECSNVLKQLFNRGEYNHLYLNGSSDVINPKINNHIGIKIGEITKVIKGNFNEVYFTSREKIENGDMLKIFENDKEICTTTINDLSRESYSEYMMTTTNNLLKKGQTLNLICDISLENEINNSPLFLNIDMEFYAFENKKAKLIVKYKDIIIEKESDDILQKAQNQPLTKDICFNQFSKLKDTHFRLRNFKFETDNVFMTLGAINAMRRYVISELEIEILKRNTPKIEKINKSLPKLNDHINNSLIIAEINDEIPEIKVDKIVLPLSNFDEKLKKKVNKVIESGNKAYITLPIMARGKDLDIIDKFIFEYPTDKIGIVSNYLYGLHYLNFGYEVIAGEYMNTFNSYSVQFLKNLGVSEVILSPEINLDQVKNIKGGVIKIYGDMFYMCFAHCPKRTAYNSCEKCGTSLLIKDEKDSIFSLKSLKMEYCYNYLVSNNTLNLIGIIDPKKVFLKIDEDNLKNYIFNQKFIGNKDKKFTYGLLYKEI